MQGYIAIVGHLDRFAAATDHKGDPLNVTMSRASVYGDGRYLRRFLARWDELVRALGGEAQVLDRLQITHDDTLPLLEQSYPNAKRLFDLLIGMTPSSPHSLKYVPMSATARFAPNGERMRSMIVRALTTPNSQYWERLIASEIFAEHFSDDTDLRRQVEEQLVRNPQGAGASALAELVLRRPDLELEKLLREKTSGVNYDVATHFKLVAALSKPRCVIEELEKVLTSDLREIYKWHFPRWIPAIIRRIEKDSVVKDLLNAAMTPDASASVKASFVSLLSQASGVDERLRAFAVRELSRTESEGLPEAGFDLVSQTYRLVRQVLNETIR